MSETIVLAPKLDLAAASDLAAQLRGHTSGDVTLDMSGVKHLGALCLQVLLSASCSIRENGYSVAISNVSDRVIEQMRLMGLTPEAIARGHS
ncbi:MAG: STAS domain-containing protein [Pseudomonadota bacterium]